MPLFIIGEEAPGDAVFELEDRVVDLLSPAPVKLIIVKSAEYTVVGGFVLDEVNRT